MGSAPIKWTCTAFFWPRQLTDRAILAIRQTREKKLMSKRHALRCPQTEVTPRKLHSALLTHLADVDLPCVQDFREMFDLADANPGPIWISDVEPEQAKVRQQLQQLFPDQDVSWKEATVDEHQKHPMTDDPQLLASNINPTSIVCFAYICLSLETNPEWFFCCERLSASMARSLHLSLSLFTTSRLTPWTRGESDVVHRLNLKRSDRAILAERSSQQKKKKGVPRFVFEVSCLLWLVFSARAPESLAGGFLVAVAGCAPWLCCCSCLVHRDFRWNCPIFRFTFSPAGHTFRPQSCAKERPSWRHARLCHVQRRATNSWYCGRGFDHYGWRLYKAKCYGCFLGS